MNEKPHSSSYLTRIKGEDSMCHTPNFVASPAYYNAERRESSSSTLNSRAYIHYREPRFKRRIFDQEKEFIEQVRLHKYLHLDELEAYQEVDQAMLERYVDKTLMSYKNRFLNTITKMRNGIDNAANELCKAYRDQRYGTTTTNVSKNSESFCMLCPAKFAQYNDYVQHITSAHPDVDEPNKVFKDPWRCVHCDSWFDGSRRLLTHIRETHPTPPSATPASLQQEKSQKCVSDAEPLQSNKNRCTICKTEISTFDEAQGPSCTLYNTRVLFCTSCRSKFRTYHGTDSSNIASLSSQQRSTAAPGQHHLPHRRILVIRRKPNNIDANLPNIR